MVHRSFLWGRRLGGLTFLQGQLPFVKGRGQLDNILDGADRFQNGKASHVDAGKGEEGSAFISARQAVDFPIPLGPKMKISFFSIGTLCYFDF